LVCIGVFSGKQEFIKIPESDNEERDQITFHLNRNFFFWFIQNNLEK
jgi:hypothetical protein